MFSLFTMLCIIHFRKCGSGLRTTLMVLDNSILSSLKSGLQGVSSIN
jgi:hypothetical protein